MKYTIPQERIPKEELNIQSTYLTSDNTFHNRNLKTPKQGEFSSPGWNGFAISPTKAEKYKQNIDIFLNDDQKFGQARADAQQAILMNKQEKIRQKAIEQRAKDKELKLYESKKKDFEHNPNGLNLFAAGELH